MPLHPAALDYPRERAGMVFALPQQAGSAPGSPSQMHMKCFLLLCSVLLAGLLLSGNAFGQIIDYPSDPEAEPEKPGARPGGGGDDDDAGGGSGSTKAGELLTPSTKPGFFTGGVGPTFFDLTRGKAKKGLGVGLSGRFMVALDFGYHFSGDFTGPAIGATIEQSFDKDFYVFNPAFKFWWDIQVVDDLAIYVAPFAKAGYALGCGYESCSAVHGFNLGIGAEGRVIFNDFAMAYIRPIQGDMFLGDFFGSTFLVNYSILIGGGLTF